MNNKKVSSIKYRVSRVVFSFVFCLLPFAFCFAQEVAMGLSVNPVLVRKYHELISAREFKLYSPPADTLNLPFLDDFSKDGIYPDTSLWLDKDAFINRDYPVNPPTLGVATLDGVGPSGMPYDTLALRGSSSPADTLTSKPIHLNYLPSDSVYFSFFYEPGGRGLCPIGASTNHPIGDSLLLQFKNPSIANNDSAWTTVWFNSGYNTPPPDTAFHLVMLRVDPAYLKEGFQFRFRNWATVSGNDDHWHIDYVFLDKNRNAGDTIFSDVAFVYNSSSLLKNYTAMPWEQYQPSDMKTNLNNLLVRNNDINIQNTSFKDTIFNSAGSMLTSYNGGAANINPYITNGNSSAFSNPSLNGYVFPALSDTASFLLECYLGTNASDKDKLNDMLRYRQKFYDYYAYDDGTEEAGYGLYLNSQLPGSELAYKFTLNNPDTMVAVQILFNWIVDNQRSHEFRIMLWKDAGGIPGTVILQDSLETPQYQYIYHPTGWGNLTNDFDTYMLTSPQKLSGTFYVGLVQLYTPIDNYDLLNIGWDLNTNANITNLFWSDDGTPGSWNQSTAPGSLMIRPVFRNINALASVNNQTAISNQFNVFPNPSNGKFTMQITNNEFRMTNLEIYNVFGEKVFNSATQQLNRTSIDLSDQPNGIYFLRITDENGNAYSQKLILTK